MRNLYRNLLLGLARSALRKYNTELIIIYGWDWIEGLREGVYNVLKPQYNVRRNTYWINWDLGLPLFILGQPYSKQVGKFQLAVLVVRSAVGLVLPRSHRNYLVVSLSARSPETLEYWLKVSPLSALVLLPLKQSTEEMTDLIAEKIPAEKVLDLRSTALLRTNKGLAEELVSKNIYKFNYLQLKQVELLTEFSSRYLKPRKIEPSKDDIFSAVLKIDWADYLLKRIKTNLGKAEIS